MPPNAPDDPPSPPEATPSGGRDGQTRRVAERELLFVDQERGVQESTLVLPPEHDDEVAESGVVESAILALERLDPLAQAGGIDRPLTGDRLLPGLVPLAPLTFAAFVAACAGLACAMAYATWHAESYLFAFAIANAVLLGHVWTYHLGYRTRRRFMVFRQVLFITLLVSFVDWMLLDLVRDPPGGSAAHQSYLWGAMAANGTAAALILLHWLFLGRGYRAVSRTTGQTQSRHVRPLPRHEG